jgi:hypothetical protein
MILDFTKFTNIIFEQFLNEKRKNSETIIKH